MNTTYRLTDTDRDQITEELRQCRQAQSWAPGATRSRWTDELEAILEADDEGGDVAAAIAAAKAEAQRLASKVARRLAADAEELRIQVRSAAEWADAPQDVLDRIDDADMAGLVAVVRELDLRLPDWERDGYQIGADYAYAYASVRTWDADTDTVVVDLATAVTA